MILISGLDGNVKKLNYRPIHILMVFDVSLESLKMTTMLNLIAVSNAIVARLQGKIVALVCQQFEKDNYWQVINACTCPKNSNFEQH